MPFCSPDVASMRISRQILALAIGLVFSFAAIAENDWTLEDILPPGVSVASKKPSDVTGISMLELSDGSIVYQVDDSPYFFLGDLYSFSQGRLSNLSEVHRGERRAETLAAVDPEGTVVFPAVGSKRTTLWVFTDVTCGYCQLFHRQIADYNALGLEVRYLAFPRFGMDSESGSLLTTAWCARDRQDAITRLKAGEELPPKECDSPVAEHFELGQRLGVNGTPAIFSQSGALLRGYVPPDQILMRLGIESPAGG